MPHQFTNNTHITTTPYAVLPTDDVLSVNTSTAKTINLPASPSVGDMYLVKDVTGSANSNHITISGNGHNIDGAGSYTLNANYQGVIVNYDGFNWFLLSDLTPAGAITLAGDVTGPGSSNQVISITGASGVINVATSGNIITWNKATTAPGLAQTAQTTDVATADMSLTPQKHFNGASTNPIGGNLTITLDIPAAQATGTQTKGNFQILDGYNGGVNLFKVMSNAANGNGWSILQFGSSTSCFLEVGSDGRMDFNCPSIFQLTNSLGNPVLAQSTNVQFCGTNSVFQLGGGTGVMVLKEASVVPTTNPTAATIIYVDPSDHKLKCRGASGTVTVLALP